MIDIMFPPNGPTEAKELGSQTVVFELWIHGQTLCHFCPNSICLVTSRSKLPESPSLLVN